jgi:hypothetical protein
MRKQFEQIVEILVHTEVKSGVMDEVRDRVMDCMGYKILDQLEDQTWYGVADQVVDQVSERILKLTRELKWN